jgi:glycine hydroxymethyltransferase
MDLSHGGHLTHGSPVTFMSKIFNFIGYKTLPDGSIDYDELRHLAHIHRPKMLLAGFSSYTRQLDYARFAQIANEINAIAFADMSHIGGLIAAGVVPNPLDA